MKKVVTIEQIATAIKEGYTLRKKGVGYSYTKSGLKIEDPDYSGERYSPGTISEKIGCPNSIIDQAFETRPYLVELYEETQHQVRFDLGLVPTKRVPKEKVEWVLESVEVVGSTDTSVEISADTPDDEEEVEEFEAVQAAW